MTDEEIIELGVQAGIIPWAKHEYIGGNKFSVSDEGLDGDRASLIQFAKLIAEKERAELAVYAVDLARQAVAKEREACATVCDSFQERDVGMQPAECAGAIRARNNK